MAATDRSASRLLVCQPTIEIRMTRRPLKVLPLSQQVPSRWTHEEPRPLLAARRLARDPRVQELRRLTPIWWVVRAYLVVAAIALAAGASWSLRYFLVPHLGSAWLGLLVIAAAAALSIWIGLRTPRATRLVVLGNLWSRRGCEVLIVWWDVLAFSGTAVP